MPPPLQCVRIVEIELNEMFRKYTSNFRNYTPTLLYLLQIQIGDFVTATTLQMCENCQISAK